MTVLARRENAHYANVKHAQGVDQQREIQLSGSDLEILIDESDRKSPGRSGPPPLPMRPKQPKESAVSEQSSQRRTQFVAHHTNPLVMWGICAVLWGAMAATVFALRSPTYQDTAGGRTASPSAMLQDVQPSQ